MALFLSPGPCSTMFVGVVANNGCGYGVRIQSHARFKVQQCPEKSLACTVFVSQQRDSVLEAVLQGGK